MADDTKAPDRKQTSLTLPVDVLLALQNAANRSNTPQQQIVLEALLQDARVAFEMDLNERAKGGQ